MDNNKEKPADGHDEAADAKTARSEVEELLVQRLTERAPEGNDPDADALKALPPRWEIRIQSERDPVAEETKAYRAIAREVDERYDKVDKGQSE